MEEGKLVHMTLDCIKKAISNMVHSLCRGIMSWKMLLSISEIQQALKQLAI